MVLSSGKGGFARGFTAIDISINGLSSAAIRFDDNLPHSRHRWMTAHSPLFLTQTPIGSIIPLQGDALSPGVIST